MATLTELRGSVNTRIGNHLQLASCTDTGDGEATMFKLPNENIITCTCTVAGVSVPKTTGTPHFDLDYSSGWCTFSAAPADAAEIIWNYSWRVWSDDQVDEAINAAIDVLFGEFYVRGVNDAITMGDGNEVEVVTDDTSPASLDPDSRILKVERQSGDSWLRLRGWSVHNDDGKYVHFAQSSCPSSGDVLRVTYATRPASLADDADDLTTDAGLPARAAEPIIMFAGAALLRQRTAMRVMDDRAHNQQGENIVRPYDLLNTAQAWEIKASALVAKLRMSPFFVRN